MSSAFHLIADFKKADGTALEAATRAEIRMLLGSTNVTEFIEMEDRRATSDRLDIPAYYLAEWIAENWWPLLNEPRKSEDNQEDGADFLSRHAIITAQHGFALPNVKIVSNGRRAIYVSAFARNVPYADVRFSKTASLMLNPDSVADQLRDFVSRTVHALEAKKIFETDLQVAWQSVEATTPEEELYCKMMGALGLSPYAETDAVDDILFKLVERTSERIAMDLCLVAKADELSAYSTTAKRAYEAAEAAEDTDLSPLLEIQVPADNLVTAAWKRGVQSAERVREKMKLQATDPQSGAKFLEALGVTAVGNGPRDKDILKSDEGMPIVAAILRKDAHAKIGLLQASGPGRRFAAARAAFAAWVSGANEHRLLTQAVTREQQSSRAFAAEILAPFAFLRREAGRGRVLFAEQIVDLADELSVSPGLVWKQAENNGLEVRLH